MATFTVTITTAKGENLVYTIDADTTDDAYQAALDKAAAGGHKVVGARLHVED